MRRSLKEVYFRGSQPGLANIRRRGGRLELTAEGDQLCIAASGYVGPSLLRADLAAAAEFGRRHPDGWTYLVDTSGVRFANPLNVFWLRRIRALPNLRRYVVIAPSGFVRFMIRMASWLVRPDRVVRSRAEL